MYLLFHFNVDLTGETAANGELILYIFYQHPTKGTYMGEPVRTLEQRTRIAISSDLH